MFFEAKSFVLKLLEINIQKPITCLYDNKHIETEI